MQLCNKNGNSNNVSIACILINYFIAFATTCDHRWNEVLFLLGTPTLAYFAEVEPPPVFLHNVVETWSLIHAGCDIPQA